MAFFEGWLLLSIRVNSREFADSILEFRKTSANRAHGRESCKRDRLILRHKMHLADAPMQSGPPG
jgi:hypothetical protein